MDYQIDYLGLKLKSPILLSSGDRSNGFDRIEAAIKAGAGAAFTPSILAKPMVQPEKDIYKIEGYNSVLNAQGHSDIAWKTWTEEILPEAKKAGYPVIAKTGYTLENVEEIVPKITEAGAAAIELIAPTSELMPQMVKKAISLTHLPVSAKMSGRWPNLGETADLCIAEGASAVTMMDTPGPALKIDVTNGQSMLTGNTAHGWGYGWLSGRSILPLTLAQIAKLRKAYPDIPINGVGGVISGEDALQMILVGANVVSVQSAVILEGPEAITRILEELNDLIKEHWGTLERAHNASQPYLLRHE